MLRGGGADGGDEDGVEEGGEEAAHGAQLQKEGHGGSPLTMAPFLSLIGGSRERERGDKCRQSDERPISAEITQKRNSENIWTRHSSSCPIRARTRWTSAAAVGNHVLT